MNLHASHIRGWSSRPPSTHPFPRVLVLVALLMLAGCASGNGHVSVKPTKTPFLPDLSPSATPTPGALTLAQAWGKPTIHTLPTAMDAARTHVFVFDNAVTPDGQWLIGAVEPRNFINNTTELSYAVLYNVASRQVVTMHALLHPQSQILYASTDGTWVVWSEADDQPNFFDWTMFSYNLQSRQVTQLGQAVREGGQPVVGPYPMPVINSGRVIWGEAIGPMGTGTLHNAVVRMEDLATGQVTTLATRAGNPYLDGPWALWDQFNSETGADGGTVVIQNLSTGQTEKLPLEPATTVLDGTSLAWDDTGAVYLIQDITKGVADPNTWEELAIASDLGDHLEYVSLNERIVAWRADAETEVYDRAERRLVTLPVTRGQSQAWVGANLLVWSDPESQAQQDQDSRASLIPTPTMNIIDTSTLPVNAA